MSVGSILIFLIYFSILGFSLFVTIKAIIVTIKKDTSNPTVWDKSSRNLAVIMLSLFLIITIGLMVFTILFFLFPKVIENVPMIFKMLGLTGIIVFYCCGAGLVMGMGRSVGASNKRASIVFSDIFKSFSKNKEKT